MRLVPFWLGLFVVAYMIVQVLNPAWVFERDPGGRMLTARQDYIAWLPSGVRAPLGVMDPILMVMVLIPGWMLACSIWVALRRPKSMRIILWVMVLNVSLFSVVGLFEALTHTTKMLWLFERPVLKSLFWGTIVNPNHAAAFMNIGLGAALALLIHYTRSGARGKEFSKGGAFLMLIPFSIIILGGVAQAMSRAGILATGLIGLTFLAIVFVRVGRLLLISGNRRITIAASAAVLMIVAVISVSVGRSIDIKRFIREMKSLTSVAESPMEDTRYCINMASVDLFKMKPAYGWGGGCYRYFIRITQRDYPSLMPGRYNLNLVYAHNDYMNYLCDLGVVGAVPLGMFVFGPVFFVIAFRRRGVDSFVVMGLACIGATMLHAAVEFFMQHPLVVMQFSIFLACLTQTADRRHFMPGGSHWITTESGDRSDLSGVS